MHSQRSRSIRAAVFASFTREPRTYALPSFTRGRRGVCLAFFVALAFFGLLALFSGNTEAGGVALAAGAVLKAGDLEEILEQIFGIADGAGSSKDEMRAALDEIADLADPDTELERDADGTWSVVEDEDAEADDE